MNKCSLENIYNTAIENWRLKKGIGTILLPAPLNPHEVILKVLEKIYERNPKSDVLIVTKDFASRNEIVYSLTHASDEDNNKEFRELIDKKYLRLYSHDFLTRWNYRDKFNLCIVCGINDYTANMKKVFELSIFKLVILSNIIEDVNTKTRLYKDIPLVDEVLPNELLAINLNSPIEEERIGITISDENEAKLLKRYDEYIQQSIAIFGSFDIMEQCRKGNTSLNISSTTIREQIAHENGWSKDLDMDVPINVLIDKTYNPNALLERAENTYEIIRKRSQLVTDNKSKLIKILEICLANKGKKILIVSKRSEFASAITEYLNKNIPNTGKTNLDGDIFDTDQPVFRTYPVCANFHDKVEKVPAWDDRGRPILIKSGAEKGKQKMMGSKAQKNENQRLFNEGYITILSTNNAVDKSLKCVIDLMIITSPICDTIKELKYRLDGVQFNSTPNKIIKLYCKNSIEEKALNKEQPNEFHKIVNNSEISSSFDENNGVVIVD